MVRRGKIAVAGFSAEMIARVKGLLGNPEVIVFETPEMLWQALPAGGVFGVDVVFVGTDGMGASPELSRALDNFYAPAVICADGGLEGSWGDQVQTIDLRRRGVEGAVATYLAIRGPVRPEAPGWRSS